MRSVKILEIFHNPNSERYALYYSIVLIVVVATILIQSFGLIEMSPIEGIAVFFEGFVSLIMLSRHTRTKESFPQHISKIRKIIAL